MHLHLCPHGAPGVPASPPLAPAPKKVQGGGLWEGTGVSPVGPGRLGSTHIQTSFPNRSILFSPELLLMWREEQSSSCNPCWNNCMGSIPQLGAQVSKPINSQAVQMCAPKPESRHGPHALHLHSARWFLECRRGCWLLPATLDIDGTGMINFIFKMRKQTQKHPPPC